MVELSIRNLLYRHLQPLAQASGCKLFIADAATHKWWHDSLEKKCKALEVDKDELKGLYEAIEEYGFIAILKRKDYKGAPEIAPFFSKIGLQERDIHYLRSKNAKNYPNWGDLDSTIPLEKRVFLYWFPVVVSDDDAGLIHVG